MPPNGAKWEFAEAALRGCVKLKARHRIALGCVSSVSKRDALPVQSTNTKPATMA